MIAVRGEVLRVQGDVFLGHLIVVKRFALYGVAPRPVRVRGVLVVLFLARLPEVPPQGSSYVD